MHISIPFSFLLTDLVIKTFRRFITIFTLSQLSEKFNYIFSSTVLISLQDLQSEIEAHRVVYDRLDGTGRKLLGSLTSQEDAIMLQRRLDEMNQRWNHLKSKSLAIR